MKASKPIYTILFCAMLFSCKTDPPSSTVSFNKQLFDRERSAWEALNLTDYHWTERDSGALGPGNKVKLTVVDGRFSRVEAVDSWLIEQVAEHEGTYSLTNRYKAGTISGLYEWIDRWYAETMQKISSGEYDLLHAEISYDSVYHYPESVSLSSGKTPAVSAADTAAPSADGNIYWPMGHAPTRVYITDFGTDD
jgi:hypothetical protein